MDKKNVIRIVKSFVKILEGKGIKIRAAYLYGSYAKGIPILHSDFDVAIVSDDFTGDPVRDIKITFQALKQSDSRIEPVYFRPEDFRDEDPLVWEIKSNGICLFPVVSDKECIKILKKVGFYLKRQEGRHVTLRRDKPFAQVVIPLRKELGWRTLRSIIRHSGLSLDEFIKLL